MIAGLHDHFNRGRLSIEVFFLAIKGNLKAFKLETRKKIGWKKASIERRP